MCFVPGDPAAPRFGYYLNVARSQAHGVEAAAALTLGGLTVGGNYSWIVAEDRAEGSASFGNWLPRRPRHSANASASYAFGFRSEEHTSELQSLMRISYAVFCLKKK